MHKFTKILKDPKKIREEKMETKVDNAKKFLKTHFEYVPKIIKYKRLIKFLFALALLCNFISATTGFTFVHSVLTTIIDPVVATCFAAVILLTIEFCKHETIYPFLLELRENFERMEIKLIGMYAVFIIFLMGTSLFFSYNGGKSVVVNYTAQPKLGDTNKTKEYYDAQIATIEEKIKWNKSENEKTESWKIINKTIPALQKNIASLQRQRDSEVNTTGTSNQLAVAKSEKQISFNAATVSLIAVTCDALLFLILWFILELRIDGRNEFDDLESDTSIIVATKKNTPTQSAKLPAPNTAPNQSPALPAPNNQPSHLKVLQSAANSAITEYYPIQKTADEQNLIPGKMIEHQKKNNEVVWYSYKQALHLRDGYQKRLNEAQTEKGRTTNQKQVDYYNSRLPEFFYTENETTGGGDTTDNLRDTA